MSGPPPLLVLDVVCFKEALHLSNGRMIPSHSDRACRRNRTGSGKDTGIPEPNSTAESDATLRINCAKCCMIQHSCQFFFSGSVRRALTEA